MLDGVHVRRATPDDALAIATVHVRSWQAAYRGLLPQPYLDALDPRVGRTEWDSVLAATSWPTTGTLVLARRPHRGPGHHGGGGDTGDVVGFAALAPTRDEDDDPGLVGELQTLYLDPPSWHRGGGTQLLGAVERQLTEAGFAMVAAWVLETNTAARGFYEARGWQADGTSRPHDWGTFVVTDVRYRKALG